MDNLTHSLVGAVLGRAGLKRLTPRAMPALIISANLPDIDSFVAPLLGEEPIAFHRGFTHGLGGLLTMPLLAAALILLWERLRPGKQGPIKVGGLLVACLIGTLSHPMLDLMNTYGVRLLEPFSNRWFYADALFIIDAWIWIALILGLEMSWRADRLGRDWRRPAWWALGAVAAYTALNFAISSRAEAVARPLVERVAPPRMIVASPPPIEFWKRRLLWRGDALGGSGSYNPLEGLNRARLEPEITPLRLDDPRLAAAIKVNREVRGFLFWSRMPMVVEQGGRSFLTDQRFHDRPRRRLSGGSFLIPLDNPRPAP